MVSPRLAGCRRVLIALDARIEFATDAATVRASPVRCYINLQSYIFLQPVLTNLNTICTSTSAYLRVVSLPRCIPLDAPHHQRTLRERLPVVDRQGVLPVLHHHVVSALPHLLLVPSHRGGQFLSGVCLHGAEVCLQLRHVGDGISQALATVYIVTTPDDISIRECARLQNKTRHSRNVMA